MITDGQSQVVIDVERSDGQRFKVGSGTDWKLPSDSIKDWNSLDYAVSTGENVLTDGSSLVSKRVNEIDRTFSAVYKGADPASARAQAISFFNPKHSFKAHVTYMGRTRWCEGEQIGFKASTANIYQPPEITFTLLCLDPYLRSESGSESAFGDSTPAMGWPFVSHVRKVLPDGAKHPAGFRASVLVYDGKNTVWNTGDVPTMYRVRIEADGELVNPTITKDGRFVRMLLTMGAGDVLVIDFESAPPKVTLNGASAIHRASRDSSFTKMQMDVGRNVFSFSVDNAENRGLAKVQVLHHKRYLGV